MKRYTMLIALLLGMLTGYGYLRYLNHHPIKVWHQFPQLTRKIPIFKKIDQFFMISLGIDWYKVKHKITGKEYLLKTGYSWSKETSFVNHYWVMDNERRDRWVEFSQDQFKESFGSPADGEAMQEVCNP